jgi:hypothetical protein
MAHLRKKNRHEDRRLGPEVSQWYKSKIEAALERTRPSLAVTVRSKNMI